MRTTGNLPPSGHSTTPSPDANRAEWPYASGQRPGCGFPIVGALISHSLVGEWCNAARPGDIPLGDGDRLSTWRKRWTKQSMTVSPERRAGFPDEIRVRVITAKIRARGFRDETIAIATSLLDPQKYPKETILAWYLRSCSGGFLLIASLAFCRALDVMREMSV